MHVYIMKRANKLNKGGKKKN